MEPSEIRQIVLVWLYDRSQLSDLPKSETAILNGLDRQGDRIALPQLREAIDFLIDLGYVTTVKPGMGGSRAQWMWRITAAGKSHREALT